MSETYNNIIKSRIGRVRATAKADYYFPVVGQTVRIDAATRWGQNSEWQINDGGGISTTAGNLVKQKDSKDITISAGGELQQKFIARNNLTQTVVSKMIYAMIPQVLPYFDVTATEIVRVGDTGYINIVAGNGYPTSRNNTIAARIYKENGSEPVKSFGFDTSRPGPTIWASSAFSFDAGTDRGIYDVEVDVTDTLTGVILTKRIDKLITVTPKLCPKPTDTTTGYEVSSTYDSQTTYGGKQVFEVRLWRNVAGGGLHYAEAVIPHGDRISSYERMKIGLLPGGTTLCLRLDPREPEAYACRFLPTGTVDVNAGNENGSPNFTYAAPLVITHDNEEVWNFVWQYYGAVNLANNLRNMVLDGRGYHDTGIKFTPMPGTTYNTCFFLSAGTSDFEMFDVDIDGSGFAGVAAKTDPDANNPWFWRENGWEFKNLRIHHCTIRNTYGEGVYLGYYGTGAMSGTNNSGEKVTYHAHILRDLRLYRCRFYHTGYDPVQINSAVGVEVCDLDIEKCCYKKEVNQSNAFSCIMDGRLYNCKVRDHYSIIGIIFPFLSSLEVFNNIFVADKDSMVFSWTKWSENGGNETWDPDGDLQNGTHVYRICNNIIKGRTIATYNGNIVFSKFMMNDNVFITSDGEDSLPANFTGEGNVFIRNNEEYDVLDTYLKVADSANYNYQPNFNSLLVSAGKSAFAAYDMRGYKRWYNNVHHCGPLMGIYKDSGIPDIETMLNSIALTFVADLTVDVVFNHSGSFVPTQYRIGETADLSATGWMDYTDSVTYTFGSAGNKTLYGRLRNAGGDESEVKSATITIREAAHKAVISFGWNRNSLAGKTGQEFDIANKLTRVAYYHGEPVFYWQNGSKAGVIQKLDASSASTSMMQDSSKGASTGDNGGDYPDEILEHNVVMSSNGTSYRSCLINIAPGTYLIRIFCSTIFARESIAFMSIQIVTGEGETEVIKDVVIPDNYTTKNNLTGWLETEVTVPASGFKLNWGIKDAGGTYYVCPLNVIEIEKV